MTTLRIYIGMLWREHHKPKPGRYNMNPCLVDIHVPPTTFNCLASAHSPSFTSMCTGGQVLTAARLSSCIYYEWKEQHAIALGEAQSHSSKHRGRACFD